MAGMTKAENRAAAKTYHRERMRRLDEEAEAERVKADLAELDRLRRYLIFGTQSRRGGIREKLMAAIDDYVEEMTGDRTRLHAKNHKCG
jgi:hypothetical protein